MRLYLASPDLRVIKKLRSIDPLRKPNILLSFGSQNPHTSAFFGSNRGDVGSIILDSGTWSLNNSKESTRQRITPDGYEAYLKAFGGNVDFYFNFDESFEENTSFDINLGHQLRLEKAEFEPVYVLHSTSGEEVEYCIKRKYPYVAVGSRSLQNKKATKLITEHLFKNGIKVHLFGLTKYDFLESIPAFSCDSSTWTKAAIMVDAIMYWNPHRTGVNKTDTIHLETTISNGTCGGFQFMSYPHRKELEDFLSSNLHLTYGDLLGHDGPLNRKLVNMFYFLELEERITQHHHELGFPY